MRQTAFIETSAINWFHDAGFDSNKMHALFVSQNLIPIVGMNTIDSLRVINLYRVKRSALFFLYSILSMPAFWFRK